MNGKDYVATVSDITDKAGDVLAAIGETCERVPAASLPWLLEQGYIAPAPAADGGE